MYVGSKLYLSILLNTNNIQLCKAKNIININIRNTMKISFLKKITYFRLFANDCTASTFSNYNYKIFDDIKKISYTFSEPLFLFD